VYHIYELQDFLYFVNGVPLEKFPSLIVAQLAKEFPAVYGARSLINVFRGARMLLPAVLCVFPTL
jgi:hypothetical protein